MASITSDSSAQTDLEQVNSATLVMSSIATDSSTKMDLDPVNSAGRCEDWLPTIKMTELVLKYLYPITRMDKVGTKYGEKIVLDLEEKSTVYLPLRMAKYFAKNPMQYDSLLQAIEEKKLFLNYLGGKNNCFEFISK